VEDAELKIDFYNQPIWESVCVYSNETEVDNVY